ncbi:MAG: hypothetical protein AAF757_15080 [Cyanobacteria bacterium P01_D01_bin.116]
MSKEQEPSVVGASCSLAFQFPITNSQSPITNPQLPITNSQFLIPK